LLNEPFRAASGLVPYRDGMPRSSTRAALIAVGVFVVIVIILKLAGAPLYDWLKALHGPPAGGGH
jgi:hypothetical protein